MANTSSDYNVHLLKNVIPVWEIIDCFWSGKWKALKALEEEYFIFAPKMFLVGPYRPITNLHKRRFELDPKKFLYEYTREQLDKMQENIDNNGLKIVQSLLLPESCLTYIVEQARMKLRTNDNKARQEISDFAIYFAK